MALLLLLGTLLAFIFYFYGIGLWHLGLLPLICCIALFWYYSAVLPPVFQDKQIWRIYGAHLGWLAILGGIIGVMSFFLISGWTIAFIIVGINVVAMYISYLVSYRDGTKVFTLGYSLGLLYMLGQIVSQQTSALRIDGFTLVTGLHLGINAFLIFIVCYNKHIEKYWRYSLFVTVIITLLLITYHSISGLYMSLLGCIIVLGLIYTGMYMIWLRKPPAVQEKKALTLREILAGHKILGTKYTAPLTSMQRLYGFIQGMPRPTRYILEGLNVLLVLIAIISYMQDFSISLSPSTQVIYRGIIIIFVVNIGILKYLGFSSTMQKIALYAVVNFAIYLTLFMVFGDTIASIVGWGILRNILSSLLIFWGPESFLARILNKQDYYYWIAMTIAACLLNIFLLGRTGLPGQLVFSLAFLYIGLQCMLLYYAVRHLDSL